MNRENLAGDLINNSRNKATVLGHVAMVLGKAKLDLCWDWQGTSRARRRAFTAATLLLPLLSLTAARPLARSLSIIGASLVSCGEETWMLTCVANGLHCQAQRFVLGGTKANWWLLPSVVPEGSLRVPTGFNVLRGELDSGTEGACSTSVGETSLGRCSRETGGQCW